MKFKVSAKITGIIEADHSHEAKSIFRQGYDVGYIVENVGLEILPQEDTRKTMNKALADKKEKSESKKSSSVKTSRR